MPGPFPGMDPYLEAPDYWRGLHTSLITFMAAALNETLPQGYVAHIEARPYVLQPQNRFYPDVSVLLAAPENLSKAGGVALAEPADAPEVVIAYPEEITERFIEVRTLGKPRRVVTVIEILSPTNKASGGLGNQEYRNKQRDLLQSDVHLLEIDLLRQGLYTVATPQENVLLKGRWDYLISLHRSNDPYRYEFWRNSVRQPLPRATVPLATESEKVDLNLQTVFNLAYDAGRYQDEVDYTTDPIPPLQGDDAVWMDTLLREKGLRP